MALTAWPVGAILDTVTVESNDQYKPFTVTYDFHFFVQGVKVSRSHTFTQAEEAMTEAEYNDAVDAIATVMET